MGEALKVLVGPDADGMSDSTVSPLKRIWAQEYQAWWEESLDNKDCWVYVWALVVYNDLRAEDQAVRLGGNRCE